MNKSNTPLIKHIPDFLDYCDVVKGLSAKSIEDYHRFIKKFVLWLEQNNLGGLKPHDLSSQHIYQYRLYLSRHANFKNHGQLKKSTQNYYLIAIRALLLYFTAKDIISLPADKVVLAKEKNVRKVNFLNLSQLQKLLSSPSLNNVKGLRDRAILESLFSTGMRVGELAGLDRDQINLDFLKKNKLTELELPVTGKGGYTRTVYFSRRSLDAIISYLELRKDTDKPLFISFSRFKNLENRLTTKSIERLVKKYVHLAGLPLNTSPHTLRHSFATDLLNQGVDLRIVQEFLGHQNISTTQIYTHVTSKKLKDIHQKFHSGERLKG
ncbi:hypothetical protein C4569_00230 [Candidatus Parcubacteria bacterium]|nr:MAG: hypothetical protein C4569_00230 [Candidatus Parcubacteria bacterium]